MSVSHLHCTPINDSLVGVAEVEHPQDAATEDEQKRRQTSQSSENGRQLHLHPFVQSARVLGHPFRVEAIHDDGLGTSLGVHGEQQDPIRRVRGQVAHVEGHWRVLEEGGQ